MKKLFFILIVLATITFSCKKKNTYILSEEEFINVIVDIHLADAFYSNNQFGELKLIEVDSSVYYKSIFEKHNIEKAKFDSTLKTYTMQPQLMESIYDRVIDKLKKMEAEQDKLEEQRIKDEEEESI